jgi:enamine deaminase RidA (YjgF/YER057c/UK114 family)
MKHYDIFNDLYWDYFILKPARSVVAVNGLPREANIMIDLIACKDPNSNNSIKRDWSP